MNQLLERVKTLRVDLANAEQALRDDVEKRKNAIDNDLKEAGLIRRGRPAGKKKKPAQ